MPQVDRIVSIPSRYPANPSAPKAYPGGHLDALVCADAERNTGSNSSRVPLPQRGVVVEVTGQRSPRFPFGHLVITPAAAQVIPADEAISALARHAAGDWGNVPSDDWTSNDEALRDGGRLFSAYRSRGNVTFWIITESDRSVTSIILPDDY